MKTRLGEEIAENVLVPRWALEFVLWRYKHKVPHRDRVDTAEFILQNCLDTQRRQDR